MLNIQAEIVLVDVVSQMYTDNRHHTFWLNFYYKDQLLW